MKNNIIRKTIVGIWRFYKRLKFRQNNIIIDYGVEFNRNTKFFKLIKINRKSLINGASIDSYSYIGQKCVLNNCKIGKFCSIGSDVHIVASQHPTTGYISSSPIFYSDKKQCGITFSEEKKYKEHKTIDGYSAIIENDVWIGEHVYIMGGVTIGNGAVVALGSIVTKDVPPYAVVAGVPARVIRYRFDNETIEQLLKDEWWNKPIDWIKDNYHSFHDKEKYLSLISK